MHVETSDQGRLSLGFGGYTLNWGVHLCGLYETDEEHDQLVYDVLHQGDLDGELLRERPKVAVEDRAVPRGVAALVAAELSGRIFRARRRIAFLAVRARPLTPSKAAFWATKPERRLFSWS